MTSDPGRIESASQAFSAIYDSDHWGLATESAVDAQRKQEFAGVIADFIRQNAVRSVAELGCGFFVFSRFIDWTGLEYDGYDVAEQVVRYNKDVYGRDNIRFHLVRDGTTMPGADLLLCKDVFQHLPNADIRYYLSGFRRSFKYMLVTNDACPEAEANLDIPSGGWRPIRLDRPPFDQQCAVLHVWDGASFGKSWTKHTCLLLGDPGAGRAAAPFVLRDRGAETG